VTSDEPERGKREEFEARAADRLMFFSDAVVAIAITLLAIDLPVPAGGTAGVFWSSVRHNDGEYLSFLVSFVTIAAAWSQHHDLFRYVKRTDARLRNLNMIWLLTIILIPFATKLLTSNGSDTVTVHAFRFGFYALLQALASAVLLAMAREMRAQALPALGERRADRADSGWQSYGPVLGWGLSIPVFFVTTYGWVLWFAVPALIARLSRRQRRKSNSPVWNGP